MSFKDKDETLTTTSGRQIVDDSGLRTSASYSVHSNVLAGDDGEVMEGDRLGVELDRRIVRKIDLRLCTIAGLLCAMDLIDSGIMGSASATSMPTDIGLVGDRYSTAVWIVTLARVAFTLPATIAMRFAGPPVFFTATTVLFGLITLCMAYVTDWKQMIGLRFLMGLAMAGIYPGLSYLISTWLVGTVARD